MKTVVAHIWYKTNESNTEKFKLNDGKVFRGTHWHFQIVVLWLAIYLLLTVCVCVCTWWLSPTVYTAFRVLSHINKQDAIKHMSSIKVIMTWCYVSSRLNKPRQWQKASKRNWLSLSPSSVMIIALTTDSTNQWEPPCTTYNL